VRRSILALALVAVVALAGCSTLTGGQPADEQETTIPDEQAEVANDDPGATDVNQTLRIEVDETIAGAEWTAIGTSYPREQFTVDAAQHEEIVLGVDTDGDGQLDRSFNETHISGVNNNAYSFDVTLDTGYTLQEGDVVVVGYPAVDNPSEPGEYQVEVRLNDGQSSTGTITIG